MEEKKVLMIQETKPQYRGTWSLPAGSMEQGQTIVVRTSLCIQNFNMQLNYNTIPVTKVSIAAVKLILHFTGSSEKL